MALRNRNYHQIIFGHKLAPWRGVHMGRGIMHLSRDTVREAININFTNGVIETRDGTRREEQRDGTIWTVVLTKSAKVTAAGISVEICAIT